MAPKRVVKAATGPRRSTRAKHEPDLFINSENSVAPKAPTRKRTADAETPASASKRSKPNKAAKPAASVSAAAKAPAKRGRPPKPRPESKATQIAKRGRLAKASPTAQPEVLTRGRGRPKKAEAIPTATSNTPTKRGRPPKSDKAPAASSSTVSQAKKTPVSRKRPARKDAAPTTSKATAPRKPPQSRAPPAARGRPSKRPAEDEAEVPEPKRSKALPRAEKPAQPKEPTAKPKKPTAPSIAPAPRVSNRAPTRKFTILLTGQGDSGELGMGVGKPGINAKRPRLNQNLLPDKMGVVQLAAGGMHCVALTHDNQILTWGVNDQGALGRNTDWDGGVKDMDEDSDSDSDAGGDINPHEATPAAVDPTNFRPGTQFAQVVAGDSVTFALTTDGLVYGWGTFRDNQGILGFTKRGDVQRTPIQIATLSEIKSIACGSNFVMALDSTGGICTWGAGQMGQLGYNVEDEIDALQPKELVLEENITEIFAGSDHSFAISKTGKVFAWGLNNFGQCGLDFNPAEPIPVNTPTPVTKLNDRTIAMLAGGNHHTLALTTDGTALAWGRCDKCQLGFDVSGFPEQDIGRTELQKTVAVLKVPAVIKTLPQGQIKQVAAGSDHSIAVTQNGKAYSWGFSAQFETGQGTDEDVTTATLIDNTAIRNQKVQWVGCGGQFSVFATTPADAAEAEQGLDGASALATGANAVDINHSSVHPNANHVNSINSGGKDLHGDTIMTNTEAVATHAPATDPCRRARSKTPIPSPTRTNRGTKAVSSQAPANHIPSTNGTVNQLGAASTSTSVTGGASTARQDAGQDGRPPALTAASVAGFQHLAAMGGVPGYQRDESSMLTDDVETFHANGW